jgi:hypothetical protein
MRDYKSIFEFLTIENPVAISPEKVKPPSGPPHDFVPAQLLPWEEFNMKTFRALYGERLIQEAQSNNRDLRKPRLEEDEQKVEDEATTKSLIDQWILPMTREALLDVRNELHPAMWTSKTSRRKDAKGKPLREKILRQDIATKSLCKVCREQDLESYWKTVERFPKEVKPYPLFNSNRVLSALTIEGYWDQARKTKGDELAIRQAYTYCIRYGCRYGCILSAHEAFIFRIKPLRQPIGL